MTPGRELDALVAEKVFGISVPEGDIEQKQLGPFPQGDETREWGINTRVRGGGRSWYYRGLAYSTNIAAAWEVWERLVVLTIEAKLWGPKLAITIPRMNGEDRLYVVRLSNDTYGGHNEGHSDDTIWRGAAPTLPHAICLAALKAVE